MTTIALDCRMIPERVDGLSRYVSSLADAMAHANRPFDITLLIPNELAADHPLAKAHSWPVHVVSAPRAMLGPANHLASRGVYASVRADLYHYPHFDLPIGCPAPTVVTIHDVTPFVFHGFFRGRYAWLKRAYFWLSTARAVRRASAVIVPSQASAEQLAARFPVPRARLHVVYEGVSRTFLDGPTPTEVADVLTEHALSRPYLLYVGVDRPHKNLPGLLRAYAKAATIIPDDLVIAGQRIWADATMRSLTERLGLQQRVRWLGYVSDEHLASLYRGARAFVLCSFFEGFGLPVIEAMASGTPVVVSRTGAAAEVAGDAALLIDPTSEEEITNALVLVATSDGMRRDLTMRGLRRAGAFNWARAGEQTIQIYLAALQSSVAE